MKEKGERGDEDEGREGVKRDRVRQRRERGRERGEVEGKEVE